MDGGDRLVGDEGLFHPGDFQVVDEVALHILAVHPFQVGPSHHLVFSLLRSPGFGFE